MAKRKLSKDQQKAFEQEQLNRPVNPTGEGEAEAIKALLSPEFEKMSNFKATDIALMLQQIIRGQNSLLANADQTNIQIAKLREHQDKIDKQIANMVHVERKEIEDIFQQSKKLRAAGDRKDKIIAKGTAQFTKAVQQARAGQASNRILFEQQLKIMPTESVISPGVWLNTREGMKIVPEEIRIKHKIWVLPPGVMTQVPKIVAERLREIRKSQIETQKRKEMLSKHMEQTKLAQQWSELEGSTAQPIPLA